MREKRGETDDGEARPGVSGMFVVSSHDPAKAPLHRILSRCGRRRFLKRASEAFQLGGTAEEEPWSRVLPRPSQ